MEGGGAGPSSEQAALALLQAVLRRDEAAVRAALAAGAPLAFNGVGALHIEALADWAEGVRLLLDAGAKLDVHESFGYRDEEAAAPLGLTAGQEAALGESWMVRTPLQVAILSGAASAAAALLAAETRAEQDRPIFRHSSQYFSLLPALAQRTAKEAGATAAEEAVPAALQQMCSVPAGGLPPGHAARDAYTSAVQLAFPPAPARAPGPVPPRWDWLLQHLLQLHTSGQLGAEHATAVASAVDALARLSAEDPRAEAAAVQWLRVPAAAGLTPPQLDSMLQQGLAGEALSALLAHPAARQALLERAQVRPCDQRAAAPISLVATAASTELPEVLDAVLAAGGAVTLNDVNLLATARGWASNPGALALLLSRGVPPVPVEAPAGQEVPWGVCPIYAVLQMVNDELAYMDDGDDPPEEDDVQELHTKALRMIETLADAGYRPSTFRNYREGEGEGARVRPTFYPPTDVPGVARQWELSSTCKWLWKAAQREPWSPATHASFPPAFRAAARALLLVAQRGGSSAPTPASAAAAGLASLPTGGLQHVLRLAAYPLAAWKPQVEGGTVLEGIWQEEANFGNEYEYLYGGGDEY